MKFPPHTHLADNDTALSPSSAPDTALRLWLIGQALANSPGKQESLTIAKAVRQMVDKMIRQLAEEEK